VTDPDTRRLLEAGFRWLGEPIPGRELWAHNDYPHRSFWRDEALAELETLEVNK
jgi:hypothetical protein